MGQVLFQDIRIGSLNGCDIFFPLCFVGSENPGPLHCEVGILSQYLPRFYPSGYRISIISGVMCDEIFLKYEI